MVSFSSIAIRFNRRFVLTLGDDEPVFGRFQKDDEIALELFVDVATGQQCLANLGLSQLDVGGSVCFVGGIDFEKLF